MADRDIERTVDGLEPGEPVHEPLTGVPDTGDLVGTEGVDPIPDEVTDPHDASYVEPDRSAIPIFGSES